MDIVEVLLQLILMVYLGILVLMTTLDTLVNGREALEKEHLQENLLWPFIAWENLKNFRR